MLTALLVAVVWDDLPRALAELERSRARITRADISWERTDFRGSFVPGIPKRYRSAFTEHESAFFADGTYSEEGAELGVTAWTPDGEPIYDSRYANLSTAESRWSFETDNLIGTLRSRAPEPGERDSDVRLIGLMPVPDLHSEVSTLLRGRQNGPARSYRESQANGLQVVECVFEGGDEKYVWYIDPDKDWNCVRAQAIVRGNVIAESVTEYQKSETGAWFPSTVDYFATGMEPLVHVDVSSVRINTPDLPERLTPDFIGFGSCMQVTVPDASGASGSIMKYVSGGRLATLDEYPKLLESGQTAVDPRMMSRETERRRAREARAAADEALAKRAQALAQAPSSRPADEWEQYTLDFIQRFHLDSDQSQRAFVILLNCQQRRDAYLKSRESKLADLGKELLSNRDPEHQKRVNEQLELLRKPVSEIFEKQLKPRLEKLPTRKQIQAASQP